jgi:hypothetical protein
MHQHGRVALVEGSGEEGHRIRGQERLYLRKVDDRHDQAAVVLGGHGEL